MLCKILTSLYREASRSIAMLRDISFFLKSLLGGVEKYEIIEKSNQKNNSNMLQIITVESFPLPDKRGSKEKNILSVAGEKEIQFQFQSLNKNVLFKKPSKEARGFTRGERTQNLIGKRHQMLSLQYKERLKIDFIKIKKQNNGT
eukprot:TRINITY_DN13040_c0_g3_i1.p1 TRINITY_DN13040_c0_g3~~TRINITY_DN13040_c0_g3_i1.p1  ORF type:complete len:145 (-),score=12.35 TRINITY_DN13040_c0_g3_i1:129-563(-)